MVQARFNVECFHLSWTSPFRAKDMNNWHNDHGRVLRMSEKDLRDLLQALKDVTAEHASSRETAQEFLQNQGVLTPNGELTEPTARAKP